jgi:nicotinate-nucleotide adenylyltransferase
MSSAAPARFAPNSWGDRRRRRVGLLGGSFNPAHGGHLHISLAALKRLRLDEVWWLVSPQNPLKPARGMAGLAERLAGAARMARHPAIRVSALETALGTRYTADTLEALRMRFPRARFVWLMGADNLQQIPRWRRWIGIFHSVPVAILDRSPYSFKALAGKAARRFARSRVASRRAGGLSDMRPPAWIFLHIRPHPASATGIRAAARRAEQREGENHNTAT